jgi:hypothetical protein
MMLSGMQMMAMCHRGVMRRLFVIARLVMLCGFAMVLGCVFMVLSSLCVVFVNFVVFHRDPPE